MNVTAVAVDRVIARSFAPGELVVGVGYSQQIWIGNVNELPSVSQQLGGSVVVVVGTAVVDVVVVVEVVVVQ